MLVGIIVGIIAGFLAGQFMNGSGYGIFTDLLLGFFGGIVGSFVLGLVGIGASGIIGSVLVSTFGAVLLIWIVPVRWITPTQLTVASPSSDWLVPASGFHTTMSLLRISPPRPDSSSR